MYHPRQTKLIWRPGQSLAQARLLSGEPDSHKDVPSLQFVWKQKMNADAMVVAWQPLSKSTPLSATIRRVQVIQQAQQDGIVMANALDAGTVKQLESISKDSPTSSIRAKLELPRTQLESAERLHEVGLLSELGSDVVLEYLRSDKAQADLDSFNVQATMLSKAEQDRMLEEEMRIHELNKDLERMGLPHSDYLYKAKKVVVPDIEKFVTDLSELAEKQHFEIPPPFKGATLLDAVRERTQRVVDATESWMADAVLDCLRLIGDAVVHVHASTGRSLDMIAETYVLPIVDSGFRTQRERLLHRLLYEAFKSRLNITRGGVVLGYQGFGKSQLVRQLVLGKELWQWTTDNRKGHVGMYVHNPNELDDALRLGCPPALLAAGLCNAGVIEREKAPAWTKSGESGLDSFDVAGWVYKNDVDALLVIDEAQQAKVDPAGEAVTKALIARSRKFWDSLDACCQNPHFPMTVITGTGSEVAYLVYDRPRGVKWKMQKDKFHMHWLDYEYSEVEICLMLTRQGKMTQLPKDGMRWTPSYSPDDRPLDIESLTAIVDQVYLEDVTLALALAVARASGCDPASDSKSSSAEPVVDSHWIETGQVVHPRLEHVVEGIQADARGDLEAWQQIKVKPDRLTLQAATEALKDERVLHAAYASRSKILRRVWQTGMTARSLSGINAEDQQMNKKLRVWYESMARDTDGFQQIMLALLECMRDEDSDWQRDAFANPLKPPKPVAVEALVEKFELMHPDVKVEDTDQFEQKLSEWRLKQLVAYRAASEQAGFEGRNLPATVGFMSSMFAFLALRWSLTQGLFVTRREFWAIHKQTGDLGKDYELVVAESLHRNFVSKVLAKELMPSVPRYLWEKEDGALKEDLVKHDRTQVFESGKISIQLTQTNWGQNPSREELLGRVLKEAPDKYGGDLVVILEDTQERDPQKYHLIRMQVKAGGVDSKIEPRGLNGFLSRDKVQTVLQLYAGALGVRPDQVVMHRLLVTPKELEPSITDLFPKRNRSEDREMDSGIAEPSTSEPVGADDQGKAESDMDGTYDRSNLFYLDHNDYHEFLFADARLLSARIWANSASKFEERQRRRKLAEELANSLRRLGLLNDSRKVKAGEPSNMENWSEQFAIDGTSEDLGKGRGRGLGKGKGRGKGKDLSEARAASSED